MAYTETQGYGSRLVQSIKGVLLGLVLFAISFPVLWWNEGRAVQTAKSLAEGAANVVSVTDVEEDNEGKLVHVSGQASTEEVLADQELGVTAAALRLQREVSMYQWYEKTASQENLGGSKTTVYTYDKKWSDALIPSARFKEAGHANPAQMKVGARSLTATKARLGRFDLSSGIIAEHVDKWSILPFALVGDTLKAHLPADLRDQAKEDGDSLYLGESPSSPQIGDCKLTYRIVRSPLTMSIVAKQIGRGFGPYAAKAGDEILLTAMEDKDADHMFTAAEAENANLTWILRGLGWFLMTMGIFLVLRPFVMLVNFIPFAGSFASLGAFVLAGIGASGFSLGTMAAAWIYYRPLLAVVLFVGAALGVVLTVTAMRRARASKARARASA